MCIFKKNYTHLLSCLTNLLGSTNSKRIALNLKPFSTSVHMNLTYVITTATKICTNEFSIKFHNLYFFKFITFFYSFNQFQLDFKWLDISTPLSVIHFQSIDSRLVSFYTFFNGWQLPCPPSSCLRIDTSFLGSRWAEILTLYSNDWISPHRPSCLPRKAH